MREVHLKNMIHGVHLEARPEVHLGVLQEAHQEARRELMKTKSFQKSMNHLKILMEGDLLETLKAEVHPEILARGDHQEAPEVHPETLMAQDLQEMWMVLADHLEILMGPPDLQGILKGLPGP